jgi:diguanylate cyclase (GGDEF)-like protein
MMLENRISGTLRLESVKRNAYSADDLRILYVIADIAAVAMNNARLYARTEELAIRDGLTNLYVQRYFKERLRDELKRAERKKHIFSLLFFDIDHFKHYNDKHGHAAGDIVLKHIAYTLHKFAGTGDVIARYGGEEFAVILAGQDKGGAARIANDIRKHVSKDMIALRDQKTCVTVSAGVATYPNDGSSEETLIRIADSNLYKAKKEGRNKVCS